MSSASIDFDLQLGKDSLWIVSEPEKVESFLVRCGQGEWSHGGLQSCEVLAKGPLLTIAQTNELKRIVLDRDSYFLGCKRCLPPDPHFALRLWKKERCMDLMVDLHRAGWVFHCGDEEFWSWCDPVVRELIILAKSLFPKQASSSPRCVWRRGAMEDLARQRLSYTVRQPGCEGRG